MVVEIHSIRQVSLIRHMGLLNLVRKFVFKPAIKEYSIGIAKVKVRARQSFKLVKAKHTEAIINGMAVIKTNTVDFDTAEVRVVRNSRIATKVKEHTTTANANAIMGIMVDAIIARVVIVVGHASADVVANSTFED